MRHPRFSRRFEKSRDVPMRPDLDTRRRVILAAVGEILGLVPASGRAGKADVDVPAGIAGIVRAWKPHRKGPEILPRLPASPADELVEGRMEPGAVHGALEWLIAVTAKPDDRPGPRGGIAGIARQVAPQHGAAFVRKRAWKGALDFDKSVLNELLDLRVAEGARGVLFVGRHEILISLGQPSSSAECGPVGRFGLDRRASPTLGTGPFLPPAQMRRQSLSGSGRKPKRYGRFCSS